MGVALIVGGATGFGRHSYGALVIFAVVTGAAFLLGSLWAGLSPKPLLIVSADGISAPLMRRPEPMRWERIAAVRVGAAYMQNSLDVHLWREVGRPEAGTRLGLRIPSGACPRV